MKALFLDRDGVINADRGYVYRACDFEFKSGIFELCALFAQKGYEIFVVTNQSGIARGFYSERDFEILSEFMLAEFAKKGVKIAKIYHCPHLEGCECRKPKPGMILRARAEFGVNLSESVLIGDNLTDMQAGANAGVGTLCLVGSDENLGKICSKNNGEFSGKKCEFSSKIHGENSKKREFKCKNSGEREFSSEIQGENSQKAEFSAKFNGSREFSAEFSVKNGENFYQKFTDLNAIKAYFKDKL